MRVLILQILKDVEVMCLLCNYYRCMFLKIIFRVDQFLKNQLLCTVHCTDVYIVGSMITE